LVGVLMFRLRQQFYVVRLLPLRDACDLCGVHTLQLWEVTHGLCPFPSFFFVMLLLCFLYSREQENYFLRSYTWRGPIRVLEVFW
jgi:hypothetical protein